MPFPYRDCKKYFSVKTSDLLFETWVWVIYPEVTSLRGVVSSMKLHCDLSVRQGLQRIGKGLVPVMPAFTGLAKMGEACFGGLEKNKHEWNRPAIACTTI